MLIKLPILKVFSDITEKLKNELSEIEDMNLENSDHNNMVDMFISGCLSPKNIVPGLAENKKIQQTVERYIRAKYNYPPGFIDFEEKYHKRKKLGKIVKDDYPLKN